MKPEQDESTGRESGHDRWLVSYADFITLMFAFFAVLYATSQKDFEKSHDFQESIKKFLIKAGAFGESGGQIQQGTKNNSVIEPPIETYKPQKPETVKVLDEAEAFVQNGLSKDERGKFVLDVTADDWGVRLTLPSTALFASGSDKFRAEALPFVAKLGALLSKTHRKILIEGHVSAGEKGSFASTWDFASARAVNVLRVIQKSQKLEGSSLAAASFGDSRPLEQNDKPSVNSRIEVVLLNQEYEL